VWKIATTEEYDVWFENLDVPEKIEILAKVELLKEYGPHLSRPHADTLNGSKFANMKELRAKTSAAAIRIAFAFDPNRSAILLIGGDKSGVGQKRFYKQLIALADRLFREHLKRL